MASRIENIFAASRFVLPEQRELYLQLKEDQKLSEQPTLEEDELANFQYLIKDSAREDYAVTVTWWKPVKANLGTFCSLWGMIKWIDQNTRRIKIANDESVEWIDIDKITDVKA
ncbi:YolD-like family protein [Brevibacillus fulvus]|uniref:YolD-like family protein n=1 Tax=Brevibacillus fulvus TaxID=1125967 RepID=A0A938Y2M9_9BACL|nr:YolD-like family protein [Brevibacillus fulvus]MBM7590856.1 hypothetical protein [Brevibacillus fulvus]